MTSRPGIVLNDVDVPTPSCPLNQEMLVEVEMSEPTVSCEVVAMMPLPVEFDVKMELAGNEVTPVPPFANGTVPARVPNPRQVELIA